MNAFLNLILSLVLTVFIFILGLWVLSLIVDESYVFSWPQWAKIALLIWLFISILITSIIAFRLNRAA